jgi:hypothetical protein
VNQSINLFWNGQLRQIISAPHTGTITVNWTSLNVQNGQTYTVLATTTGTINASASRTFVVPCPDVTATPAGATSTPTPAPADLIIVGQPSLISTPPIVAYQPVQIGVSITNTGDIDVSSQFFVDIFFDPTQIFSDHIPIAFSSGYIAVGNLAGGATRVLTITAPNGFNHIPPHYVYGMVDSLRTAAESIETNNVSGGLPVSVTPANSPTPSPPPSGSDTVSGVIRSFIGSWVPQRRARVWLQNQTTPTTIFGPIESDENGVYTFTGVPSNIGAFTVIACLPSDTLDFVGQRPGVLPPHFTANVYMSPNAAGCPLQ